MKRSRRISALPLTAIVLATGCAAPSEAPQEGPTEEAASPLLCSNGYPMKYYRDFDGDHHARATGTLFCNAPGAGWYDEPGDDCNDNDAKVYPGAPEIVGDGKDSNCDGKDPDGAGPVTNSYREVSLKVFRFCDNDGTDCSPVTRENVQRAVDSMNSYLYRSDSRIRVKISTSTATITAGQISAANFGTINSDSWNGACKPKSNLGGYAEDANGDGVVNDADKTFLCPKTTSNALFDADLEKFQKAVEAAGDVPIFGRGGTKEVTFADGAWSRTGWTGGYSSCGGHAVMLTSNWGSGTFMAHEVGHYLCLPHTMLEGDGRPETVPEAATQIKNYVAATGINPTLDSTILQGLYDPDRNLGGYTNELAYIQSYPINDTPPDPGSPLFSSVHGEACATTGSSVVVPVYHGAPWYLTRNYTITPDRTLIMSYYKGCFGTKQHYTPQQVKRMEAVTSSIGHRDNVAKDISFGGFNNTLNVTIPPRPGLGVGDLQWASSSIPATGWGSPSRVRVHVDLKHPSNVHVKLVAPNGTEFPLSDATANDGYVKGIFYVNGAGLPKAGTWTLKVAAQYGDPEGATGAIYDWRVEFE